MNKSIGVILGVATLVILVVFFLFDSSKRDMIIGKWYVQEGVLEFHDNNDVTSPDFEDAIWILSDNEEIIEVHFISDKLRESILLELVSVSEEELCVRYNKSNEQRCFSRVLDLSLIHISEPTRRYDI